MRAENALTEPVRLFEWLAGQEGREFAFRWFRDGVGYFLSARTWVP